MNGMDTLTTSKILQEAGVTVKHAEAIALLFNSNNNVATQEFVEAKISNLTNKMFITAISLTGIIIASIKIL